MGSSNSRLGSSRRSMKKRLSSLLVCGGGSSSTSHEMDDHPVEFLVSSAEGQRTILVDLQSSAKEETSTLFSEIECSHSAIDASPISNNTVIGSPTEYHSRCVETSSDAKCFRGNKELFPDIPNDVHSPLDSYSERNCDMGSSSSAERHSPQAVSNRSPAVFEVDYSKTEGGSERLPEVVCSSSTSQQEPEQSSADWILPTEYTPNVVFGIQRSVPSVPVFPESSLPTSQPPRNETAQEETPRSPFFMLDSERDRENESVLHVDVVSISSSSLFSGTREVSHPEARRNSRRLFWDAFSRHGSRRHSDPRTLLFSSEDSDDLGSQDRWLLDFGGDLFEDGVGSVSGYLGSRSHGIHEGRWHSRSEIWDRFRGGFHESNRHTTICASGLHPDGTCSCESFLTAEESGTRGSISRIVMLAEALFEVLDEIHRQPLSLSLSMVSLPAPESIVNSFPLKSHKNLKAAENGDDAEQCYICLAEYEKDDQIRVLPCRHEFHMACVDKWLKEIHGVCPLCRGDVCAGVAEGSISSSG